MKKRTILLITLLLTINSYGQYKFALTNRLSSELYNEANLNIKSHKGTELINNLYTKAIREHDKTAEAAAIYMRSKNLKYITSKKEYENSARTYMKQCVSNNDMTTYFKIWESMIDFKIKDLELDAAQKEVVNFCEEAQKSGNKYAILQSYRISGELYQKKKQRELALEAFLNGYRYRKEINDTEEAADFSTCVGLAYFNMHKYETAQKYFLEAENECEKESPEWFRTLIYNGLACHQLGQDDVMMSYYHRTLEYEKKFPDRSPDNFIILKLYALFHLKKYDEYEKCANQVTNKMQRYAYLYKLYNTTNNYQKALENFEKYNLQEDSIVNIKAINDINDINKKIGNERLFRERQTLLIEQLKFQQRMAEERSRSTFLRLHNKSLLIESERSRLDKENARTIEKKGLEQSELERYELITQQQKAEIILADKKSQSKKALYLTAMSILLLSIVSFFIYYERKKSILKTINAKNKELLEIQKYYIEERKKADNANSVKTSFIENMSNEIKAPLNAISGFSQLLADKNIDGIPGQKKEISELIQKNSDVVIQIINDILFLSDLQNGNVDYNIAEYSPNQLCEQAKSYIINKCPEGVMMKFVKELNDEYTIATDKKRIMHVLTNYLTNACKYTSSGEIRIGCNDKENEGCLTFYVEDTGIGIPAKNADSIFNNIYGSNNESLGNGIGLSIVRTRAEQMECIAKLDTKYKDGSRFVFIIPIKR